MKFASERGTLPLRGLSLTCLAAGAAIAGCGGSSSKHATAANAASLASVAGAQCEWGQFSATVRRGPDAHLSVGGRMRLMLGPSGSIDGAVVARGRPLLFAGTAQGSSMQIALTARDGLQMRGAGTATMPIRGCADVPHSGSLSGPRKADTGDWALAELSREASRYEAERASASKAERSEKLTPEKIAE